MKAASLVSFVYPFTRAKLHRIVTVVGVAFAGLAVGTVWLREMGLTLEGKVGATIGMLTTLAAGWQRARPKLDEAINSLPIPEDDRQPENGVIEVIFLGVFALGAYLAARHLHHLAQIGQ